MEVIYFGNEFPKEDLQHVFRRLYSHSTERRHRLLAQFLTDATYAIKEEIKQLPLALQQLFPPFETLHMWAEDLHLRECLLCGAVDGVLLILVQIASYILHIETDPDACRHLSDTHFTGIGVGLLSAAAASLSEETSQLPSYGTEAIRIAFRMGVHVHYVSQQLEARDLADAPQTWAYVVHNVRPTQARQELEVLCKATSTSATSKIFISAISHNSVTVSGPPSKLKFLFRKSKMFRDATSVALPVYGGLCHAPHVYTSRDTTVIVHGRNNALNTSHRKNGTKCRPLHSTSTGMPYCVATAVELFESVVTELLTQTIDWDKVVTNVLDVVKREVFSAVLLVSFGNSIPLRDLVLALQTNVDGIRVGIENCMSFLQETVSSSSMLREPKQAKLAIVGMSCRLPGGATDVEKFWELLLDGRDVSREIPADRFDIDTHYDADGKDMNKTMTRFGCFIDEPGLFDAAFFNMSPREAMTVDPQMRLALVTAYEALEKAGFVGNHSLSVNPERIGTYYGQAADDYREVNQGQEVGTYYIPGGCRAFGPGRINYFFKFAGPSYSIDTACSSGLAAIEVACQALWNGDIDMAVAGGVNILSNPDGFTGLCKGYFLSKGHNACKTWDATADGYCRADGIGTLVIKRLEDAQVDNDNILGVILAAGTNHSAEAVSITHPHAGHQSFLSRQVLRQAAVNPLDVSYVELHGTGTQAGDYEEMKGVLDVYAPSVSPFRKLNQALHIGSVKPNVGHGESVAGTTSLIKVLLMLQNKIIPPHIGIKTKINPRFPKDLEKRNVHIPLSPLPWPSVPGRMRIAAVNNFGAAGGNTMLILEEAPLTKSPRIEDPRSTHVVAVSAKTKRSLVANIQRLVAALDRYSDSIGLADLSYSTTARKYQHSYRVAVSASDIREVDKQLALQLEKIDSLQPVSKSESLSVAFTFTGQGASHPSMSLELYHYVPTFREHVQQLDGIAQAQGFPSFIPAIDGSYASDHQHSAVVTQLALVCIEIALAQYWSTLGVKPSLVIGHSLGEYAALHVAGVISAGDAIFMVGRRAEMLQTECKVGSHCMMAVRASLADINAALVNKSYEIACINSPFDTVLSGTTACINDVAVSLEAAGYRCIKLGVMFAFHSEQTDPILEDFEQVVELGVIFHEPKLPVISPLLGRAVFDGRTLNANYVRRATRETVDFKSALENAYNISAICNDTIWIEIGPHPVCTDFIKTTLSSTRVAVPSLCRGENNWKTLSESMTALHLAGVDLNWQEFHSPFIKSLSLVDLPTYAWDEKNYWLQYNGDWCLTKGNTFYHDNLPTTKIMVEAAEIQESLSSSAQRIVQMTVEGNAGTVLVQSDLMQKEFLDAAYSHRMNDCGVVTSSIHADIAYTLGGYLCRKLHQQSSTVDMDIRNLVVTKALVAKKVKMDIPQRIQVSASTEDIDSGILDLAWHNLETDGTVSKPFATAHIVLGKRDQWLSAWSPMHHLVQSRIEVLQSLVAQGKACLLPRNMAYTLFAKNLVDYEDKYRGMQSVVMHGLEGFAEVQLSTKADTGKWTVPPYFIDSVAHLAGFIMNCSDAIDTQNNYCVTSGWKSMKFAEPLVAGAHYRSYVKMIPTKEDSSVYLGDVYVLRAKDNEIIGMVAGIHFRSFPRILLDKFFSPPDAAATPAAAPRNEKNINCIPKQIASKKPVKLSDISTDSDSGYGEGQSIDLVQISNSHRKLGAHASTTSSGSSTITREEIATPTSHSYSVARKALQLIARESALAVSSLTDEAQFINLGIDSLMSLVLVEKFRVELDVKVNGSLFLDYPTIGDLRRWLEEYYG